MYPATSNASESEHTLWERLLRSRVRLRNANDVRHHGAHPPVGERISYLERVGGLNQPAHGLREFENELQSGLVGGHESVLRPLTVEVAGFRPAHLLGQVGVNQCQ